MRRLQHIVPALALLAACGGGSDGPEPPSAPTGSTGNPTGNPTGTPAGGGSTSSSIAVGDNSFTPSATTVARGTTVTWSWTGRNPHDVTFDDGAKSATQAAGTFTRTFGAAGSFPYHCSVHGASMSGTITVQ